MSDYKNTKLYDIGKIVTGKTPETTDPLNSGSDYMFLGPTDLHKHFIISRSEKMISTKGLLSIKGSVIDGLSILVGCIGWDMGNVALVKGKCVTNQQINSITKIKDFYNPFYIYYWFKQKKHYLFQIASVTRTPMLKKSDFSNIELNIPNKHQQDKVSNILISLDSKIELNNRVNAELEAISKTLYDYWFVQFDFPDAKGRPYKNSGGKMFWNDELKREIPKGWTKGSLSDIGNIIGGTTPSKEIDENFDDNGMPWITPKDLSLNMGNKFITKGGISVSDQGLKAALLKIMPKGTVLLSSRAPIGYMAISREEVTTNQGFKSFVPKDHFSTEYIYYTVQNAIPAIVNNASGSTFKEVSGGVLKTIAICVPPKVVIKAYTKIVEPIFKKQSLLEVENQQLADLRDWLLPMLMNGQITVQGAKQGGVLAEAQRLVGPSNSQSEGKMLDFAPKFEITMPNNNLKQAILVAMIKRQLGINYGEVGIQKTVFNVAAFSPGFTEMDYEFAKSHYGTYSPQLTDDLRANPYLIKKVVKGNNECYAVNSRYEADVNDALLQQEYAAYVSAINKMLTVYKDPFIGKKTDKIELLNTVAKLIMDFQATDIDTIYKGMEEWEINQPGYNTKADKFSKPDTEKMIKLIKDRELVDVLLNN